MAELLGRLVPVGGGDPIPLLSEVMTVGRRESCDICLKFSNVSSVHCEFALRNGLWTVRDMGSSNGIKVNGSRTLQRTLKPGSEVAIASHKFVIEYEIPDGVTLDEAADGAENVFGQSLMERAGLSKPKRS
jgi:pSer/pThr/pTyr-binding forkhead associated (FHA) protein